MRILVDAAIAERREKTASARKVPIGVRLMRNASERAATTRQLRAIRAFLARSIVLNRIYVYIGIARQALCAESGRQTAYDRRVKIFVRELESQFFSTYELKTEFNSLKCSAIKFIINRTNSLRKNEAEIKSSEFRTCHPSAIFAPSNFEIYKIFRRKDLRNGVIVNRAPVEAAFARG